MKKICVITGTRAEYGLLRPLMKKIEEDKELILQIVATGMHLSPEFGLTYREIEDNGFNIDEKLEMVLSSDTEVGISKSVGLGMISFSDTLNRLNPDMVILLGDRYEIFAAASAAMIARIPIAHIHGGETTEGAIDESMRHSITKMSYLHFTSTECYRNRVIQLGEEPSRVFNVGAIAYDSIKELELLSKKDLEKNLNFNINFPTAIVTFHPTTLEEKASEVQFQEILNAFKNIPDLNLIFTKSNSDTDGRIINQMIDEFTLENIDRSLSVSSLGQLKYFSALKYVDLVIGNSSSGIIEVPEFKIPTINIGDRQKGRVKADSVLDSLVLEKDILSKIKISLSNEFKKDIEKVINPYTGINVSNSILKIIKENIFEKDINLKKKFFDMNQ